MHIWLYEDQMGDEKVAFHNLEAFISWVRRAPEPTASQIELVDAIERDMHYGDDFYEWAGDDCLEVLTITKIEMIS